MKDVSFGITENSRIADGIYLMRLCGDSSEITAPGQFINISLDGFYLRRPISVCDKNEDGLTIIYKTLGRGTRKMSELKTGENLTALTGLGNGFDIDASGEFPLLIGGGVGVPPMYLLAKELIGQGKKPHIAMGFNKKSDVFFAGEFRALGCSVSIATADGSFGEKGFVTDILPQEYSYYYACGPEPMLKTVYKAAKGNGELSFEKRMGCGFGACMGCSCKTITGYKRICKDGPVLKKEEILWED